MFEFSGRVDVESREREGRRVGDPWERRGLGEWGWGGDRGDIEGRRGCGSGFQVDLLGLVDEEREETEKTMKKDNDREDGLGSTRRKERSAQGDSK